MGFRATTPQAQFLGKQKLRYGGGTAGLWKVTPRKEKRSIRMEQEKPSD